MSNSRYFVYKMVADSGGAPCVESGLLTLAICKPKIRKSAQPGDYVFGIGGAALEHRLIYIALIKENLSGKEYYTNAKYLGRSDCIYEYVGKEFKWKKGSKYHDESLLVHDLGHPPSYNAASVLISEDFRYYGSNGVVPNQDIFPHLFKLAKELKQGHRVNHPEDLKKDLEKMIGENWKSPVMVQGKPSHSASDKNHGNCGNDSCELGECEIKMSNPR